MIFHPILTSLRLLSLLMIFVAVSSSNSFSQVNTEKFRKYYTKEGFHYNLGSTFALRAGNSEYGSVRFNGRIDNNRKKFDQFLVANFEYKSTAEEQITNNGFVHLRGMWNIKPQLNWEFFLQQAYDRFVDLNSRSLIGTTVKYRLFENISIDSSRAFEIDVSTGIMYENEIYNSEPEDIKRVLMRSTNFVSIDWMVKEKLNVNGVFYYQPAFNNINDYRFASWLTIDFAIVKRLYFVFQIWYKYNSRPVNDVKPWDLSIENGVRFEFP